MTVKYDYPQQGVAQVTLNRPDKLNSFNRQLRADLTAALSKASADDAVRAVILTGEGRAFCAGADVSAVEEMGNVEDVLNTEYAGFLNIIQTMPKPVIAAINGPAAGIGMSLALTCDLRVMGEGAYLMSAFANIGLVPDGGLSWLLTQEVGYSRAYQLAIEAKKIGAEEAFDFGLVNRTAADKELLSVAVKWAASLCERAPIALGLTKRAFRAAAQDGLKAAMAYEATLQRQAIATHDCAEGVAALMQKRKPSFKGN